MVLLNILVIQPQARCTAGEILLEPWRPVPIKAYLVLRESWSRMLVRTSGESFSRGAINAKMGKVFRLLLENSMVIVRTLFTNITPLCHIC